MPLRSRQAWDAHDAVTLGSPSQPLALLWRLLIVLARDFVSQRLMFDTEGKTWCGLPPYLVPAILLGCAFGHNGNQVMGDGMVYTITMAGPADRCLICDHDFAGVTQETRCLGSCSLRVHACRWGKGHVFLSWFPGC